MITHGYIYRYAPLIVAVFLVTTLVMFYVARTTRELTVSFLDVGNGSAVLVESPSGTVVLIGGGPDASVLRELGRTLPFWKRTIDMVMVPSKASGVVGGLPEVVARYKVGALVAPEAIDTRAGEVLFERFSSEYVDVNTYVARRGMRFDLGSGAYIDTLAPDVFRLAYGDTVFMFSGDLSQRSLEKLITLDESFGLLRADVVAIPHEGKTSEALDTWLALLRAHWAVISVANYNRYNYPSTDTIASIVKHSMKLVRTDTSGRAVFVSDGERVVHK